MKFFLLAILVLPSLSLAQVELTTEAFEVIEKTLESGKPQTQWIKPDNIVPGDKIGYKITIKNSSNDAADNLVLSNPIPEHTLYIDGSARGANATIQFSIDKAGKAFAKPSELFVEENGKRILATAKHYTHVKWILNQSIPAGEESSVQYVVQVK